MTPRIQTVAAQQDVAVDLSAPLRLILNLQQPDGAIPWSVGDKTDPWDHVESAMALAIGGALDAARRAFEWLRNTQLTDGSWYAAHVDGLPTDRTRETNHAAYVAVGVYHYFLVTNDIDFVRLMWPTVQRATDFVLHHQMPSGEICWAVSPEGRIDRMALITGCSSIRFSLKCALVLAHLMDIDRSDWRSALARLQQCLTDKPHRFNTTKARFSMDWFYPILSGVVTGQSAQQRIDKYWKKFVAQDLGVRCVSDRPWVTIAESCELVLALKAMGSHQQAEIVFRWICDHTFDDGSFWCGFTFPDMVIWPEEKISWTNAVVILAADALYQLSPAATIFSHDHWREMDI